MEKSKHMDPLASGVLRKSVDGMEAFVSLEVIPNLHRLEAVCHRDGAASGEATGNERSVRN